MAALVRWNPWSELFNLHSQMDQLFENAFGERMLSDGSGRAETTHLPVDIYQSEDAYTIEASVPGFRPEDVEVTIDDNVLTIKGQMKTEEKRDSGGYVHRERRSASVYRQVSLPQQVKADGIEAAFENGVLKVVIPREAKAQPKRIPVSSSASTARVIDAPKEGSKS